MTMYQDSVPINTRHSDTMRFRMQWITEYETLPVSQITVVWPTLHQHIIFSHFAKEVFKNFTSKGVERCVFMPNL